MGRPYTEEAIIVLRLTEAIAVTHDPKENNIRNVFIFKRSIAHQKKKIEKKNNYY